VCFFAVCDDTPLLTAEEQAFTEKALPLRPIYKCNIVSYIEMVPLVFAALPCKELELMNVAATVAAQGKRLPSCHRRG